MQLSGLVSWSASVTSNQGFIIPLPFSSLTENGFASEEERELFLKLIDVKGLGPKMAMPILATGSISGIADAIDRENVLYLKKFPKIGEKLARQIILDLKGKLVLSENISSSTNDELILALESLGYKTNDIKNIVIEKVSNTEKLTELSIKAVKFLGVLFMILLIIDIISFFIFMVLR